MEDLRNEFHALIIGVGEYVSPLFPDLPATKADAREIARILRDPTICGYDPSRVTVLLGEDATVDNLRVHLQRLVGEVSSRSTLLIYFSGHGGRQLVGSEWRSYLCLRETDPRQLDNSALSGEEMSGMLRAIRSERLVVILDSCFAGGAAQPKAVADVQPVWKSGLQDSFYTDLSRGAGRVVLASSAEDQVSRVRSEGDLSLFTYHLSAAMRGAATQPGDGFVRVLDVYNYVSDAVQRDDPEQTPIFKADAMNGNFPIAHAPRQAPALPIERDDPTPRSPTPQAAEPSTPAPQPMPTPTVTFTTGAITARQANVVQGHTVRVTFAGDQDRDEGE